MIKPIPTICMAMSLEIPKSEHAIGIRSREPPATPDAPQADKVARILKIMALGISTAIPKVWAAASVMTVIVIAAPSMLMVAPSGMVTEYVSLSSPISAQASILIGMFAAELRVKNAVMALFFKHLKISGYGFLPEYQDRIGDKVDKQHRT